MTLKIHDRNFERLNMSRYFVSYDKMYLDREEKHVLCQLALQLIVALGCYVTQRNCRNNRTLSNVIC